MEEQVRQARMDANETKEKNEKKKEDIFSLLMATTSCPGPGHDDPRSGQAMTCMRCSHQIPTLVSLVAMTDGSVHESAVAPRVR